MPALMTSVQVLPGPGIVARFGSVLLWLEEGEAGGAATAELVGLARSLADDADAGLAGGRLAEVLRRRPAAVPALVLVMADGEGLRVVVHGWGRVLTDGVDVDGGWADRQLAWPMALAAGRGGDLLRVPTPGSPLDLRRGVAPGGGAAITLAARTEAVPPPGPTPGPPGPAGEPAAGIGGS
ncbi:MAG: hypothetical protein ABIS47_05240 [Acidimicrobiales bacterium]